MEGDESGVTMSVFLGLDGNLFHLVKKYAICGILDHGHENIAYRYRKI